MPSVSWNRQRAAHLLRRAGFGGTPAELGRALTEGREATVDRLLDFERTSTADLDARLAAFRFDLTTFYNDSDSRNYEQFVNLSRWWILRMVYSPRPLEEKLTLFWHNHFASSYAKVDTPPLLYAQNQLFRRLGEGRFESLLLAVAKDPAMLFYLDNNTNVKESIQENWGRELLELFTMGVNHYSQTDVRAAAAAFTGWTTQFEPPYAFFVDDSEHDAGPKTFLGQTGNLDGTDIITILARRPETAEFVTTKLARFFLGRNPGRGLARRLQDLFLSVSGDIRAVVRAILLSDEFDESADNSDQVKSPIEFCVGALRNLGATTDGALPLDFGSLIGQALFLPPNVAGWPAWTYGTTRWINTGAYAGRLLFAELLAATIPGEASSWWQARDFFPATLGSADALIDFLAERFSMPPPSAALRRALGAYLAQMGTWRWNLDDVADRWGRGAVRLVLSSPEYQLQ